MSLLEAMGWNLPHQVRETMVAIRERWPAVDRLPPAPAQPARRDDRQLLRGAAARRARVRHLPGRHGRLPVQRQRPFGRPRAHRGFRRSVPRDGHGDRLRPRQADRGGGDRRGGGRPPAVGARVEVGPAPARPEALPRSTCRSSRRSRRRRTSARARRSTKAACLPGRHPIRCAAPEPARCAPRSAWSETFPRRSPRCP